MKFAAVAKAAGLAAVFLGAAVSLIELSQLQQHRFEALMDRRLPPQNRRSLNRSHSMRK